MLSRAKGLVEEVLQAYVEKAKLAKVKCSNEELASEIQTVFVRDFGLWVNILADVQGEVKKVSVRLVVSKQRKTISVQL